MKDLGEAKQILGKHISRDREAEKLYISQAKYIKKVLKRLSMEDAKLVFCMFWFVQDLALHMRWE